MATEAVKLVNEINSMDDDEFFEVFNHFSIETIKQIGEWAWERYVRVRIQKIRADKKSGR